MEIKKKLPYDYIRGLVEGEGTFTFSTRKKFHTKIPAFAVKMHVRDKELLEMVRDTLGLKNKVYEYNHQGKDGHVRGPQAMLIVREIGQLKNIIVPFFYKRLYGNKGKQFGEWLEKIGSDQEVSETFKFIHKIYKAGFYDKNPKFIE